MKLPDDWKLRKARIGGKDVPLYPADILIDYTRMVVIKRENPCDGGPFRRPRFLISDYPPSHHLD